MRLLSNSTATFALALSLASAAHANDSDGGNAATGTVHQSSASPGTTAAPSVPSALLEAYRAIDAQGRSLQRPPETLSSHDQERVVTTRELNARYRDISPFYGDINAFWKDINPFYRNIDAFYGNISPFWRDISPFYGNINAFWGDIDAFWKDIVAFDEAHLAALGDFWQNAGEQIAATEGYWAAIDQSGSTAGLIASLNTLIDQGEAQFGEAYTAETGGNFRNDLVAEIFVKHGIDLNDPASLSAKTEAERAAFFVDWHDTLMSYSGIDHVDHWMATINWTPAVSQIQGEKAQAVVGMLDSSLQMDPDLKDNLVYDSGSATFLDGHGAGVASLIFGAHDGRGVMGIAPDAIVTAYNPFSVEGTASWDDVAQGILHLKGGKSKDITGSVSASIINMSLGEAGWVAAPGLASAFARSDVAKHHNDTVYVIAAGNDGIVQTADIEWNYANDAAAIFVGSISPTGEISAFSNQPGAACLLENGVCHIGNELMNRFIVAPGELLLVSDGQSSVVRRSGTSFAAPLVSGTVTLLHDRWPWLAKNPEAATEIIFRSARDLGAPGVDPIYGHGLLDVTASQSPLDFGSLRFKMYYRWGGRYVRGSVSAQTLLSSGVPEWWDTRDVFFTAFEEIGDTYRDFAIPMSSFTYGKQTNALGGGYQRLQDFVSDRFANWLLSGGADRDGDGQLGISQIRSNRIGASGTWTMRVDAIQPRHADNGTIRPVHNSATLTSPTGNVSLTFGHGQGAMALAGNRFGIVSDHDARTGGVNPVLGFASGEMFAGATYRPATGSSITVGYSGNRHDWKDLDGLSDAERSLQRTLGEREASAMTIAFEQSVSKTFAIGAQWTRLREQDALLGAQTGTDALLGEGSTTDAMTVTTSLDLGSGLSLDLSATGGTTQTADGQLLASSGGVMSTAGQFTLNKYGVASQRDVLRVSVGQPLTIERGDLELRSEQVVDRTTGERGVTVQRFGIENSRRYMSEIVYATPISRGAELGIVGRIVTGDQSSNEDSLMIGANFGMRF